MEPLDGPGLAPLALPVGGQATVPGSADGSEGPPDPAPVEPDGFVVLSDDETRIHFLDWGGAPGRAAFLLIPGLANTAWAWTPVARRLRASGHVVVMDLRGHGLSDAPTDGYDPDQLAGDAIAVAEGSGLLEGDDGGSIGRPFVVAGHGFGAIVAAWTANALGPRCAGLVLVDGGWEDLGASGEATPAEWLRSIEEPPAVLASLSAWLEDRRDFDPGSWDDDQVRAARAQVVETAAGRVKLAVHAHALAGSVGALLAYDPGAVLPLVEARVVALVARDPGGGGRVDLLRAVAAKRAEAGRSPIEAAAFPTLGHNLPRYVPDLVAAAVRGAADAAPRGSGFGRP